MTHELEESDNEVVDRLLAEIRVKDKLILDIKRELSFAGHDIGLLTVTGAIKRVVLDWVEATNKIAELEKELTRLMKK